MRRSEVCMYDYVYISKLYACTDLSSRDAYWALQYVSINGSLI